MSKSSFCPRGWKRLKAEDGTGDASLRDAGWSVPYTKKNRFGSLQVDHRETLSETHMTVYAQGRRDNLELTFANTLRKPTENLELLSNGVLGTLGKWYDRCCVWEPKAPVQIKHANCRRMRWNKWGKKSTNYITFLYGKMKSFNRKPLSGCQRTIFCSFQLGAFWS